MTRTTLAAALLVLTPPVFPSGLLDLGHFGIHEFLELYLTPATTPTRLDRPCPDETPAAAVTTTTAEEPATARNAVVAQLDQPTP